MQPPQRRTEPFVTTSMRAYGISRAGVTSCIRVAPTASPKTRYSVSWESCSFAGPTGASFVSSAMKPVGKPDAGNPHVRFDERGWETGRRSGVEGTPKLRQRVKEQIH